ncbi:hypothetical protein D3C87_1579820 [compost metagenome]
MVSPGDSSTPANSEPAMIALAPAAMAFTISPVCLIPPSAITGIPVPIRACAHSKTAYNCGTPTPAMMRVVQIDPGPIPTLTASAPAAARALAASAVAMLPAITCRSGHLSLMAFTMSITPLE